MAWFARSIANSLKFDDDENEENTTTTTTTNNATDPPKSIHETDQNHEIDSSPSSTANNTPRGVKEDLSELTKTLKSQFWGVASFLAPPPLPSDPEIPDEAVISGIRSDFAEISGKFKTGISKLSSNIAVSEITKMASNFLQIGSEEYEVGNAVGVTEEVLAFAKNIALHPETWLDFPVPDEDDFDDFDMSDAQQEHALAVERLAPSLAALRIELCPGHMSEGCFWKIYFVLLHPRLNKQDAELLSTPQIVEARALLMQELQNQAKAKPEPDQSGNGFSYSKESADLLREESLSVPTYAQSKSAPLKTSDVEAVPSTVAADIETEKHPVQSTEMQVIDKSVVKEEPVNQTKHQPSPAGSPNVLDEKFEDDADDWLKEESSEIVGVSRTSVPFENDEDVSFSDLEEDDGDVPTSHKKTTSGSDSSTKDSRDWVQLSRSSTDSVKDINTVVAKRTGSEQVSARNPETKESNDWLDVDDIDVM